MQDVWTDLWPTREEDKTVIKSGVEDPEGFRLASKKYSGATAGSSLDFFQLLSAGCNHGFVSRTLK